MSFLIDSSGQVTEVLVENRTTSFLRYPLERLKVNQDEVSLMTDIEKKVGHLAGTFPILIKKKKIVENLSANNEVPPEIYENLSAEFSKALTEIKSETPKLLNDIDEQVKIQEETIKSLHLARTFLEIEHGIGNVADDTYQETLAGLLKEMNKASHGKADLLRIKTMASNVLLNSEETKTETEVKTQNDLAGGFAGEETTVNPASKDENSTIVVHMTQE